MGGSATNSPAVQSALANLLDAAGGGLNSKPALAQYTKQVREMPDAAIRGVGDAAAGIPDLPIAGGKLALQGGFNPRMGQSERVKRFDDTTYMPVNPAIQDMLTRAGVAETTGGNNLTRFMAGALAPAAAGKYVSAVDKAIDAAERGALSNAERGMVSIPTKSDLIKARQIVEDAAKRHGLEMSPTAGGGEPGWGGGMTNSKYASFRASAPDGKKFTNIDVRVSDHGEPMKRLQSGYGSNLSFDGSQSLDDFAAKTNDLFSSVSAKYKPNDLPMDEASRMARAKDMGFDMERVFYHATDKLEENGDALEDIRASPRGMIGPGVYGSPTPKFSERYPDIKTGKANTIPFVVRGKLAQITDIHNASNEAGKLLSKNGKNFDVPEWKELTNKLLQEQGFAGKEVADQIIVFDPKNIRSPYAKFNPAESNSNKLSAAVLPLSVFVGEKDDTPYDRLKRKFKGAK